MQTLRDKLIVLAAVGILAVVGSLMNSRQAAARFQHIKPVAVPCRGDDGGSRTKVLAEAQRRGTRVTDAGYSGGRGRRGRAGREQGNKGNYPIPNSSTRSRGVPQTRQIRDAQSPHTNGSFTGC